MSSPTATQEQFSGFSSGELLRRARTLREIAERETPRERRRLERLALEHEDAARHARTFAPVSRSPFTWEARADVQPIVHIGTKEDCEAWMRTVGGKDVFVMGDHGKAVLVGIVMHTSARSLP